MALSWQKQSALLKDQSSLGDPEVSLRFLFAFCKCKPASHRVQGSSRCCIRRFPSEVERTWLLSHIMVEHLISYLLAGNQLNHSSLADFLHLPPVPTKSKMLKTPPKKLLKILKEFSKTADTKQAYQKQLCFDNNELSEKEIKKNSFTIASKQ